MSEPTKKPRAPRKRRSYVLKPATSSQRSKDRRSDLNDYAKSLGHPTYTTWDKIGTAILKGKAKIVFVEENFETSFTESPKI